MSSSQSRNFSSYTVIELKEFLKTRGITTTQYSKEQLVKLCELSIQIGVATIQKNDEEDAKNSRLTIEGDHKIDLVPCKDISGWSSNLQTLPQINQGDIFSYLVRRGWSSDNLKRFKSSHGYHLFQSKHVSSVTIGNYKPPGEAKIFVYVRSLVNRETSIREVYKTWAILAVDGEVITGGCECIGDDGACKHTVALLFALDDWSSRHEDRNTIVGTDNMCTWDHGRVSSKPLPLEDISILHRSTYTMDDQKVLVIIVQLEPKENCPPKDVEKKIFSMVAGSNCQLTEAFEFTGQDTPADLKQIFANFNPVGGSWVTHLKQQTSQEYCMAVEKLTDGQAENQLWFKYRVGRVTSSTAYDVSHYRADHTKSLMSRILGESSSFNTPAVEYGRQNEPVARQLYINNHSKVHKQLVVRESGLIICRELPYLAASPDGLVSCKCCCQGLLEIKCTYKHRESTLQEIAQDRGYHFYLDSDNTLLLKRKSKWYFQVQHQILVSGRGWCDFLLYLKGGAGNQNNIHVQRIYPDDETINLIKTKSCEFFSDCILKELSQ